MPTKRKKLVWYGDSLRRLRDFSPDARKAAGFELDRIQLGREPSDWKPMTSIGPGVKEIRIWAEQGYRVIYVAKFLDEISVLHAFEKKSQKTPKIDIELAQQRYRKLINERR
jgi:phage-related protein